MEPYLKGNGDIDSEILSDHFFYSLQSVIFHPEMWNESHLSFVSFRRMRVGGVLQLVYNGPLFKLLHVSVDLVPCIQLSVNGPIPSVFERENDEGEKRYVEWPVAVDFSSCHLYALFGGIPFDVSHSDFEGVLLGMIPKAAREAYVISKALVSPDTYHHHATNALKERVSGKEWGVDITSYELKWALFISYGKLLKSKGNGGIEEISRSEWVKNIFENLDAAREYI